MRKLMIGVLLSVLPMAALADQSAEKLANLLGSVKSFQALFVQYVVDQKGTRLQDTAGYLQAKRPGLFYWETQPPMAQQIVSDGKEVWIYDPDLEQVTVKKVDANVQDTPAQLLSGNVGNLQNSYDIKSESVDKNIRHFTLIPKGNESLFEEMRMTFQNDVLNEMRLKDSLGQRTIISFSKIEVNPTIPDETFVFEVPPGVDVFREQ